MIAIPSVDPPVLLGQARDAGADAGDGVQADLGRPLAVDRSRQPEPPDIEREIGHVDPIAVASRAGREHESDRRAVRVDVAEVAQFGDHLSGLVDHHDLVGLVGGHPQVVVIVDVAVLVEGQRVRATSARKGRENRGGAGARIHIQHLVIAEVEHQQRAGLRMEREAEQQVARSGNAHLAQEASIRAGHEQLPWLPPGDDGEGRGVDVAVVVDAEALGIGESGRKRSESLNATAVPRGDSEY